MQKVQIKMDVLMEAISLILNGNADLWTIIALSLRVSLTACLVAACLAIPLGAVLTLTTFPGRRMILLLASSLMALPPVVVGLLVYLLLSRSGPLGNFGLLFTPNAMIFAQTVLVFPIVLTLTYEALKPINREYHTLFNALATPFSTKLVTLVIDARFGIATALLAGFGRALAEVGAVIIVGGNINGVTRVMTTTIALETSKGNLQLALALGAILIAIALLVNVVIHMIAARGKRYQVIR